MSDPEQPDSVRDALGDPLWDLLGQAQEPQPPAGFDEGFRQRLQQASTPRRRRIWPAITAAATVAAMAAGLLLALRNPVPDPILPSPADNDLALIAELDMIENMDLLQEMDLLQAWDGAAP